MGMDEMPAELMQASENMMPIIEWAEGQKAMLVERGWSVESGEAYALELLCGLTRSMWNGLGKTGR